MIVKQAEKLCGNISVEHYLHHSDFLATPHTQKIFNINVYAKKFLFEPVDYVIGNNNLERKNYVQIEINNKPINFTIEEAKQLIDYLQTATNCLERK